ncbi:Imm1 family immunity protein [Actinokineospora xionganensis]|uniref:Immunity protein Imm1 n=1 Tax=Actinokineospora xionganensis TaxID=2684470 RepID=A0ABR7LGR8_9PSEU|nr:Imm1 family immunity protein [Actinokineospora xionganensis]MBC6451564.1 hypothetical protein [Actinokineospora xionganensis]
MTLNASIAIVDGGVPGGKSLPIASPEDITGLVDLLRGPGSFTATIEADNAVLDAHIEHGFGYLLYSGDEAFAYSQGDPDSPAVIESEVGFPQGAGVPLETFAAALAEFLADSDTPPPSVAWQDA